MKIPPIVELFHTDRRTDMIKLIVASCYFVNVTEKLRTNALYVVLIYISMFKLIYECQQNSVARVWTGFNWLRVRSIDWLL